MKKSLTSTQNANRINGRNCAPRIRDVSKIGIANKISKAANILTTPNNLLGIDRKIAQNGNKQHSGTIDAGVCIGFAGMQLSLCPNRFGAQNTIADKANKKPKTVTRSLNVKYGWNGIRSVFPEIPNGLLEPCSCNAIRCAAAKAAKAKGNTKCNEQNRLSVALFTENPPQMNSTISCPIQGTADTKLVITVLPHSDICP